jgi:sulfite reductase beta subunit-like hemoprotein
MVSMAMTDARMKVLSDRLRAIGKSLARLTAEQLAILAEIAQSDAEDGVSERKQRAGWRI